jgi:hypothetical protein
MARATIDEVEVLLPPDHVPKKLGLRYDGKTVHLYLLSGDDAAKPEDPPRSLLDLITAVRDTYFGELPLDTLNWNIRAAYHTCAVSFRKSQTSSMQMDVSNELVCYNPHLCTINDYRQDRFKEFSPVLERAIDMPRSPATYYLQTLRDGRNYFFRNSIPDKEVVYVDTKKFAELLRQHSPEQALSAPELQHLKKNGYIGEWTGHPQAMMGLQCRQLDDRLIFSMSGFGCRYLLASLQDSGAERFPVSVSKDQAVLLKQLCGTAASAPHRQATFSAGPRGSFT